MDSQVYLTASALPELKTELYAIQTDATSVSVVMPSHYLYGLVGLAAVLAGALVLISAFEGFITSLGNWSGSLTALAVGAVFLVVGLRLSGALIDLRSIRITPGRANIAWRLFGRTIRSMAFDVRLVVIRHDRWRSCNGSTDRLVLEGQDRAHAVTTLWNRPPTGTFMPPLNTWPVGPASQLSPEAGSMDERTVSPLILGLAKSLASAASVPIVLRVGESHGPWVAFGDD